MPYLAALFATRVGLADTPHDSLARSMTADFGDRLLGILRESSFGIGAVQAKTTLFKLSAGQIEPALRQTLFESRQMACTEVSKTSDGYRFARAETAAARRRKGLRLRPEAFGTCREAA